MTVKFNPLGANFTPTSVAPTETVRAVVTIAEIRAYTTPNPTTIVVPGRGTFVWTTGVSPALDTGTESTGVVAITGDVTGAYALRVAPSSVVTETISSSVVSGITLLPRVTTGKWFGDLATPAAVALDARFGVSATGSDIDSWADQSGCGSNATQTGGNRPTYSATGWSDGGPAISFAAASSQYFQCNSLGGVLYKDIPRSVIALVRLGAGAYPTFLGYNDGAGNGRYGGYSNYGVIDSGSIANSGLTAGSVFDWTGTRDVLVVYVHRDGGGNSHLYIDGRKQVIATDAMDPLASAVSSVTIGAGIYGGSPNLLLNGLMRYLSVHSGTISEAEYKFACRNLLGGVYTRIVCDGNSLTQGGFGGGGYYPPTLQTLLGARALGRFEVDNVGVGGQNTDDMVARYPTYVAPKCSTAQHNVLVAWELSNQYVSHYSSGGTARQAVDKFWQYCDAARTAGFRLIVLTAIKRQAAGYAPVPSKAIGDAAISEMNGYIRAEWQSHADALVDPDAHPFFGNTAYTTVFPDGTHLSQSGCNVIAGLVAREVLRQIAVMA